MFLGINNDGAAFGRFFGGGFDSSCAPFDVPPGTAFAVTAASVSSTGAGRFRFVLFPGVSTAPLDEEAATTDGTVATPPLPADFIARGVTRLSGMAGLDVSTGRIFDCVLGPFAEDCGLFAVVGAVK